MLGVLIAALLTVPSASPATLLRKGDPLPLESAVESSILVCLGTVDRVVSVPCPDDWTGAMLQQPPRELAFSRIRVERVLVGDSSTEFVWHESWHTWACDTTTSLDGRRALFLLGSAETSRQSASARAAVAERLGPGLVLRNIGSGDGLLPIDTVDAGTECVHYGGAPIALDLPLPGPYPSRPYARRRGTQSLDAITQWIEELARFPSRTCMLRMQSRGLAEPRGEPFDVRFLADGSYRLATGTNEYQTVRSGNFEASAWADLCAALERACAVAAPLAPAFTAGDERKLTVRLGGSDRRWSLRATPQNSSELRPESRAAHGALLSAWTLLRGAIDCSECADHRAADALALAH